MHLSRIMAEISLVYEICSMAQYYYLSVFLLFINKKKVSLAFYF